MVRKPQNSRGDGRAVVHCHRVFAWQCDGAQCGFPWGAEPPVQFSSLGCSFSGRRGVRANTLIRANTQTHLCGPCRYKLACWWYFSLIRFLSNLPELEISQENQCIQKQELMRRLPFYFCLGSAFKFHISEMKE